MTPKAKKNGKAAQVLEAFYVGFSETSRTAFYAMLVGILVSISFYFWFFSYSTLSGPLGRYLLQNTDDIDAYATVRALEFGSKPSDRPMLLVFGTSFATSAFGSDEAIKERLDAETNLDWRVANMATALQSPLEAVSLIENALASNQGEPVVVVLGVNVVTGGWTAEDMAEFDAQPRIGVRSQWADEELKRLGYEPRPRSNNYVLENWNFAAPRAARLFVRLGLAGAYKPDFTTYVPKASLPPEKRNEQLIATQIRERASTNDGSALQVYRALSDRLRDYPSVKLVLLHEVPSVDILNRENLSKIVAIEDARYETFSKEIGTGFWSPNFDPPIPGEAFYDDFHIGDEAARQDLREALVGVVKDQFGELTDG